jgi:hypothetical protein
MSIYIFGKNLATGYLKIKEEKHSPSHPPPPPLPPKKRKKRKS